MNGRRVGSTEAALDGEPGDYFPVLLEDGTVTALWFRLPTGSMGRIAAKGYGKDGEPEWTITLEADGTVTVDPSIEQHEHKGGPDPIPYWHGHLRAGVWTG